MFKKLLRGLPALTLTALPLLVSAPPAHAADTFRIVTALNAKCLASNGDHVEVQTCRGTGNQLWYWDAGKLRNLADLHCLDARNGEVDAAAQAIGNCHGLPNQQWRTDGAWLRTQINNQCLSIQNMGEPNEHAGVNLRNCGPYAWQHWRFEA